MRQHKYTNDLIRETSPYLLQHAHNPVNWRAWNDQTLALAKKEHKPILISIGYSACHWCHVMEKESFEDEQVAAILNEKFICIKVDREERPDVDLVYMNAIQAMTGQGGWPLNMFALPDARPFHGGTYFRKNDFIKTLQLVSDEFEKNEQKLIGFADKLREGLVKQDQQMLQMSDSTFDIATIQASITKWSATFDAVWGGDDRAPKFPLPNNYQYLLQVAVMLQDEALLKHVNNSLIRMARGGIYDQIGGGFSRYSTDKYWKVPHFEKMLYDNGQLLSLYANAYKKMQFAEYKRVIDETAQWLMREMRSPEGFFYSALDADSEGEEGKYYVWTKPELKAILGAHYDFASTYFNINKLGFWEHQNYILMRDGSDELVAKELGIPIHEFQKRVMDIKKTLMEARDKRVRPGLDDKMLTSWNALTATGFLDAYQATLHRPYLQTAIHTLNWLVTHQTNVDGSLWRNYKKGKSSIDGLLDDYAFLGLACIKAYETTFETAWLNRAEHMAAYALKHFYHAQEGVFYYTKKGKDGLMMRPVELYDNVMPASSSAMAQLLFQLSVHTSNLQYEEIARNLVVKLKPLIAQAAGSFSNWGMLYCNMSLGNQELVSMGSEALSFNQQLQSKYWPNTSFAGSLTSSDLPLLADRFKPGKTLLYKCKNKVCRLPVENISVFLKD